MNGGAQSVLAEMLARPGLVHARLRLVFASTPSYGYGLRPNPARRHTSASSSSGLLMHDPS